VASVNSSVSAAARQNPELLQKYIAMEEETGYTMFASGPLAKILNLDARLPFHINVFLLPNLPRILGS